MKTIICIALFVAVVSAAPIEDEAIVDLVQDNEGYYKYTLVSKNITREEERQHDGSVKGYFSYLDEDGVKQVIHYTSGVEGFVAEGSIIPVELPEVVEARQQHQVISDTIRSLLPALKADFTVDELPEVPLSKEEFLHAVKSVANPQLPLAVPDTPEIAEAKKGFLESFSAALEN